MVQPWIPPLFLVDSFADRTAAELVAQERKGVDARIVAVAPPEAQAIASDGLDVLDRDEHRNAVRLDPELVRPLVGAGRARAVLAEIADRIHALVPIAPLNAEHAVLDPVHVLGFDGVAHGLLLMNPNATKPLPVNLAITLPYATRSVFRQRPLKSCHPEPFACHPEQSEGSRFLAQGTLREGSCHVKIDTSLRSV